MKKSKEAMRRAMEKQIFTLADLVVTIAEAEIDLH